MRRVLVLVRLPGIAFALGRAGVLGHIARLPHLPGWLAGLCRFIDRLMAGRRDDRQAGEALCAALQSLGPAFIKFGQALSTRADLLGPDVAGGLTRLQDRLPAFDGAAARALIEAETGAGLDEFFAEFDPVPVAAASVAQVHKARLADGRAVAVKLLRPGIRQRMARDIRLFHMLAGLVEWAAPGLRRLRLREAVRQFELISDIELDLRMEAAAGGKLADNLAADDGVRVPWIDVQNSTADMLISEWIDGRRIDDIQGLLAAGHDISALTERAADSFFKQIFRDGYFHADMHPGNIFVSDDGMLVPIDFGIMGHLELEDRLFLAELLLAMLERDYDRLASLHAEAGMLNAEVELALFAQSLRAVVEPVLGKNLGEIELGRALGQILQISARFDIAIQPQFNLLQKTLGMAEGVARQLSPGSNIWALAGPLAADWKSSQTGLTLKLARTGRDLARLVRLLPIVLEQWEKQTSQPAGATGHTRQPGAHKKPFMPILAAGLAGAIGGGLAVLILALAISHHLS